MHDGMYTAIVLTLSLKGAGSHMSFRWAARAALAGRSRVYCILIAGTFVLAVLSASCGKSSSSSASHNAYVTLPQKGAVAQVRLNDSTGALSLGAETPPVLGTSPTGLVLDPSQKFLFVGNAFANTVSVFNVAGDGTLTQSGDAIPVGAAPRTLLVDPSGKFLLITNNFANTVSVFSIASGALTLVGDFAAGPSPTDMKISSLGNFVYVSNSDVGLITGFNLNTATGNLTPMGAPFLARAGVAGLAIDPGSHFLYAANASDDTVSVFSIDPVTGELHEITESPYPVGKSPRAIAIDPSGAFLYVANQGSNNLSPFTITASTGELTAIGTTLPAVGTQPVFVLAEPAGTYLYVGNQGSTNVSAYSYDATTGALTAVSGSPFTVGSAPGAMTIVH
jgi:6-phosphogluconolactonase (cycloisomerase 2 family)